MIMYVWVSLCESKVKVIPMPFYRHTQGLFCSKPYRYSSYVIPGYGFFHTGLIDWFNFIARVRFAVWIFLHFKHFIFIFMLQAFNEIINMIHWIYQYTLSIFKFSKSIILANYWLIRPFKNTNLVCFKHSILKFDNHYTSFWHMATTRISKGFLSEYQCLIWIKKYSQVASKLIGKWNDAEGMCHGFYITAFHNCHNVDKEM